MTETAQTLVARWQRESQEYHNLTIVEIVEEYAAWREAQMVEINGVEEAFLRLKVSQIADGDVSISGPINAKQWRDKMFTVDADFFKREAVVGVKSFFAPFTWVYRKLKDR
jgi:hypothetical protein